MGLTPAEQAGIWGFVSAFSLPLGACVAIAPCIPDAAGTTVGLMMAFGAGSLLFAVSVEMFAKGLHELHHDDGHQLMLIMVTMSFVGALVYISLNRWLSGGNHGQAHVKVHKDALKALNKSESSLYLGGTATKSPRAARAARQNAAEVNRDETERAGAAPTKNPMGMDEDELEEVRTLTYTFSPLQER